MENNFNGNISPNQIQNFNEYPSAPKNNIQKKGTKPWKINTAIIFIVLIIGIMLPKEIASNFFGLVFFATFIFIIFDGNRIEIHKYPATFFGRSEWGYAFSSIILWPIIFPFYMSRRYKIINKEIEMKEKYREPVAK